ncbi:hypothetical protein BJP25_09500 [Actinokineospora bangkokensis]|uniref:Type I restriction modification DNA specificity domain-containing protein n=1 Tax=Actinokineospora bangkokensis TaxID=1193682 RepID=A0A1Q9LS61_9PSEU|nr:hypothetical protein BJP25_09500 [Actinokineospora bangkokensis]
MAGGIPWVAISDMSNRAEVTTTARQVTPAGVAAARLTVAPAGTLLFSVYASIGHAAVLGRAAAWNQAILGITPTDPGTDTRFLRYALLATRERLPAQARGTTQDNLTAELVRNLLLPHPDPATQRRVADALDAATADLDALARSHARELALVDDRTRTHLVAALDRPGGEGRRVPVKHLFEPERAGAWGADPDGGPDDVLCVRVADFDRRTLTAGAAATTHRRLTPDQLRTRALRPGDVLLERSGGGGKTPVGFAVSYDGPPGTRATTSNFVSILRPRPHVHPRYAALLLAARYHAGRTAAHTKQTTGIQNLDSSAYLSAAAHVPPAAAQARTAAEVDERLTAAAAHRTATERQLALIAERRHTLIATAVTGALDLSTARP